MLTETCLPNPEYLIKSIAEQGYTLESSIADLIDNSISAKADKIEVLINTEVCPFRLFLSDNGSGMSEKDLQKNMQFPSSSPEASRAKRDLGRFGLGMKTASFAQTRRFIVISKPSNATRFFGRTWDVDHLRKCGKWELIVNTEFEVAQLLDSYKAISNDFLNPLDDYRPNTIIIWEGLYKFESGSDENRSSEVLQKEITETTKQHLQLTFHRFMEKQNPLKIRLNNEVLTPFNPFPAGCRRISARKKTLLQDNLCLEGYVLPNTSIKESKGTSEWTINNRSLMDMEGMYIYRADRIISFGGWNGVIRKSPRLQLARLKVEIGNGIDHLFHLNVAKSSIIIPFTERIAFYRYVSELKSEAEKEFFNVVVRSPNIDKGVKTVFKKVPTNQGMALVIDHDFPIVGQLISSLNDEQKKQLRIIFRMINTSLNRIKKVHKDESYVNLVEKNIISEEDLKAAVTVLVKSGLSTANLKKVLFEDLGIDDQSVPIHILSLLD